MALPLLVLLAAQAIIFRKVGNERKGPRLLDEARETELKVGWVKVRVASPLFLTSNLQCSGDGSIERTATNLKATHTLKECNSCFSTKTKKGGKIDSFTLFKNHRKSLNLHY